MHVKKYTENTAGTDYVVGDIHGHFSKLQTALDEIGFNTEQDRLFSVGDLVDRGPESELSLDWITDYPWFIPVKGNHDDFVARYNTCDKDNWVYNGGAWFQGLSRYEQADFGTLFSQLPLAIEVETPFGTVGIVHAEPVVNDWSNLSEYLRASRRNRDTVMWSRDRISAGDKSVVRNIRAVVCGHTPVADTVSLGNVLYIDTKGWRPEGRFTILPLSTVANHFYTKDLTERKEQE